MSRANRSSNAARPPHTHTQTRMRTRLQATPSGTPTPPHLPRREVLHDDLGQVPAGAQARAVVADAYLLELAHVGRLKEELVRRAALKVVPGGR